MYGSIDSVLLRFYEREIVCRFVYVHKNGTVLRANNLSRGRSGINVTHKPSLLYKYVERYYYNSYKICHCFCQYTTENRVVINNKWEICQGYANMTTAEWLWQEGKSRYQFVLTQTDHQVLESHPVTCFSSIAEEELAPDHILRCDESSYLSQMLHVQFIFII
jgi:hypothetical protein